MNLKQFAKDTIKNGGASYSLTSGDYNPVTGFMVSRFRDREKVHLLETDLELRYHVARFIEDNSLLLSWGLVSDFHLGSWVKNDEVYLNIAEWVDDSEKAKDIARKHGQRTIWDCANKKEIYIN